ncbi:MAG TPA: hypothetical protein VFB62_05200, partial [Polyangiaceae bacterium]|nr:hypothetical protein [Polyangiaceae bacterium]
MRSSLRILVLFIACLWGGCDCVSDEEQLAFIEEPVEARIVYVKKTGLKLEGGPHFVVVPTGLKSSHDIVLRVEGYD